MGHRGGSATSYQSGCHSMVAKGCLATPLFFFSQIFFLKFLINFLKIFLFFYAKTRVNPQGLTPGRAISF
jgi:hypothetical protein